MSDRPLAITATGMVTGVGLDTYSSCAAIRAAIDNFQETHFLDSEGEWILGCEIPLDPPLRGIEKLTTMLCMALSECSQSTDLDINKVPVIICLSEQERPGVPANQGNQLYFKTEQKLGCHFHPESMVIKQSRTGVISGLIQARELIYSKGHQQVIVASADSLLCAESLRYFEQTDRLLTESHSDGFIPGEAAAAILLEKPDPKNTSQLICLGVGFGHEPAHIESDLPLRADGLVNAINAALQDAKLAIRDIDFRIADVTGEQFWFKESALALQRLLHQPKPEFDIWHPSDCIGEVGSAIGLINFIVLKIANEKGYSKGSTMLAHFSNWDHQRAAAVLTFGHWGAQHGQ